MDKFKKVLGTSFYLGFLPGAPGTWASLAALIPIFLLQYHFGTVSLFLFLIVSSIITLWTADACTNAWGDDPGQMVMDEWAGQSVAFLFINFNSNMFHNVAVLLVGFGFFRLFDILKPFGVNKLQDLRGGWGILMDDLLAGFYANLCLNSLIFLFIK
ncbi:MAG TPA: phosphatidylglycerophosphatase A [Balneolales bacterium]|nr:phosphatidylglycerophosphatase A [Balneolales bacterium]